MTENYVTKISGNEVVDKEAREKIKQLQEQIQALRICVLSIVRGLNSVNSGDLTSSGYESDIARSAYQLAYPGGLHELNPTKLSYITPATDAAKKEYYFNYQNHDDSKNFNDIVRNYYLKFQNSTDGASGSIDHSDQTTKDKNIF